MPDAIELIKADHRTVEELFERFEADRDVRVARRICDELTIHTELEEQLFYPLVREEVSADLAAEAEDEHQQAKQLIAEIQGLGDDDQDRLAELMTQLREDVEHHVQEEETEMLPQAQDALADELDELGRSIEQFKAEHHEELDLSKEELYEQAKQQDVEGRSKMDKEELAEAVEEQR